MNNIYNPVFPAYHPIFHGECEHCKKQKNSIVLFTKECTPNKYFCENCLFVYEFQNMKSKMEERDLKELKIYGNLFG